MSDTRKSLAAAFDALRKLAAEYDRVDPRAGERLRQELLADLQAFHRAELDALSRVSRFPGRSAA